MSDHDADPIDKAYARAEAMLDDDHARAARRARVLGAVAADAEPAPAPPRRRVPWAAGGWLAAAGVAGVSVLVALQLTAPPVMHRPTAPAETPVAAAPAPAPAPATEPGVEAPAPAPPAAPRAPAGPSADVAPPAPSIPPSAFPAPSSRVEPAPAAPTAPPPPPLARPSSEDAVEGLIATDEAAPPPSAARAARAESAMAQAPAAPAAPATGAARLHAAAAGGRLTELSALLAQGTPVDAPDSAGETALMKSIQARNPASAALLRRHGASLDRVNRAGVSARDMAAAIDDPALNRALGLEP